jgi:ethanolamine transporter
VCAAFAIGDYLAFTANFQPNMIVPMIVGKLAGGFIAVGIAMWLAVPYLKHEAPEEESDELEASNA